MGFPFRKCQEPVRRETTEGSSIEFIGYQMPYHKQMAAQSYSQGINQLGVSGFFDTLIMIGYLKLEQLDLCEACCVNGRTGRILQLSKFSNMFSFNIILGMIWRNLTKIGQI